MTDAHLAATCRWLQQSVEFREQVDCLAIPTEEGNRSYWQQRWRESDREDYAIIDVEGKHLGNCGLRGIDRQRRKAELWIYLGELHGAGCGTRALQHLLERAFGQLALNKVSLKVFATNPRALSFYAKHGFVQEGVMRHESIHRGHFVDAILMSILSGEFAANSRSG
jgi:RimJ/RimL family protein N-acetyltransferase